MRLVTVVMPGNVRNYGGWNVSIMPLNIPTLSQHCADPAAASRVTSHNRQQSCDWHQPPPLPCLHTATTLHSEDPAHGSLVRLGHQAPAAVTCLQLVNLYYMGILGTRPIGDKIVEQWPVCSFEVVFICVKQFWLSL